MKLSARQDIEASAADVFAILTDFARWERAALRHGADVQRTDSLAAPGAGMAWVASFEFQGVPRKGTVTVTGHDPAAGLVLAMESGGLTGTVDFGLVALSPRRTRLTLNAELRAKSLIGKVLLQSLRLRKKHFEQRLQARLAVLAQICDPRGQPVAGG